MRSYDLRISTSSVYTTITYERRVQQCQNLGDRQIMKIQARSYAVENLSKHQILNNLHGSLLSLSKKDIQCNPS